MKNAINPQIMISSINNVHQQEHGENARNLALTSAQAKLQL